MKKFNEHECDPKISGYYGYPCIYAAWDDSNDKDLQLLGLSGDGGYASIGVSKDEVADWTLCNPDEDIINECKEYLQEYGHDWSPEDVESAMAFYWHKNDNQYIMVLNA